MLAALKRGRLFGAARRNGSRIRLQVRATLKAEFMEAAS